jgi:hypothetical protein
VDSETIFVGHSLGGAFALRFLERMDTVIHAAFLVASVWGVMDKTFDPLMTTFTRSPYDWDRIRQHCGKFSVIHADNDPYIRLDLARDLAAHLGSTVTLVTGGGHLNAAAGYREFPLLLKEIEALL